MRKLNSNHGHTIPIVLVIVIVLTILTSSIVFAVNSSTKRTNSEIIEFTTKLEIENITYQYLNDLIEKNVELEPQTNYDYNNHIFNITSVDTNTYQFVVTNGSKYVLNATIKFESSSYEILKWGFVKE